MKSDENRHLEGERTAVGEHVDDLGHNLLIIFHEDAPKNPIESLQSLVVGDLGHLAHVDFFVFVRHVVYDADLLVPRLEEYVGQIRVVRHCFRVVE